MRENETKILLSLDVVCVPLTILNTVLIDIIIHLHIALIPSISSELSISSTSSLELIQNDSGVYYIRISAIVLVLLASFAGSMASSMVDFFMILLFYPISDNIVRISEMGNISKLSISYQLSLLIITLNDDVETL